MTDAGLLAQMRPTEPLILVVDDDHRVRELLEIAFGSQGYRVVVAADGEEALRSASSSPPDLIVLDVRLPRRSGLDVCERLRRETESATVPIIVVSAATEGEVRLQAFQRGADDFLVKPFSPRELLARARRLLARSQEMRTARSRLASLEQELGHSKKELAAALAAREAERHRRDIIDRITTTAGSTDPEVLSANLLREARRVTGATVAALFVHQPAEYYLEPCRVHGETFDRIAGIRVAADGALAQFLASLGKPAEVQRLAHAQDLREGLGPFAAARLQILGPVVGPAGLQAFVALDSTSAVGSIRSVLETLDVVCRAARAPLAQAFDARRRALALLDLAGVPFGDEDEQSALRSAAQLVSMAVRAAGLSPGVEILARSGVLAGPHALDAGPGWALERAERCDSTRLISDLRAILRTASEPHEDSDVGDRSGVGEDDPWECCRTEAQPWVSAGWRIADRLRLGAIPADAVRGEPLGRREYQAAFARVDLATLIPT